MQGTVKRVEVERGFGFLTSPEFPRDIFFHVKQLDQDVRWDNQVTGLRVEFDLEDGERGPMAVRVRRAA